MLRSCHPPFRNVPSGPASYLPAIPGMASVTVSSLAARRGIALMALVTRRRGMGGCGDDTPSTWASSSCDVAVVGWEKVSERISAKMLDICGSDDEDEDEVCQGNVRLWTAVGRSFAHALESESLEEV